MSEGSIRGIVTAMVGVVLLGATATVPLLRKPETATPRPSGDAPQVRDDFESRSLEKIEARLWEDPVEAYASELKRRKEARQLHESPPNADRDKLADPPFYTQGDQVRRWLASHTLSEREERRFARECQRETDRQEEARAAATSLPHECQHPWPRARDRLVTAIIVPTMSRAGNVESRRGIRVALQMAMLSRGWDSRDESSIGLMRFDLPAGARKDEATKGSCHFGAAGSGAARVDVFFETFTHPSGARALVLWVDDGDIACASDASILAEQLNAWVSGTELASRNAVTTRVALVGPASNKVLIRWLKGFTETPDGGAQHSTVPDLLSPAGKEFSAPPLPLVWPAIVEVLIRPRDVAPTQHAGVPPRVFPLYSPVSTVPDEWILREVQGGHGGAARPAPAGADSGGNGMAPDRGKGSPADACQIEVRPVACLFRRHGLTFIRATVTDDLFVEALAKELRQRREALKPKECTVLMVTEADSIYARSLKREIEQRMKARPGQEENPSGPCTLLESRTERAVGSYQYLSNVNASHDSRAEANTSRSDDSGKAKPAVSIYDTHDAAAEGRQQYDYIERLASKIERDVMEGRWDTEHIFAVGLFGLDASDKVSLLKVLKPKFPQARFFSIGLDSVFLQPRNLPHARNLILAAAEDLEGGDDWSRLPPFRRSTQVNYARTFAAVLDGDEAPRLPEQAGIFEVGLKGFIRLNLDVEAVRTMTACGPLCKLWKKMQGLSPAQYLGAIALAMTMTIVGLWLAYRFAREVAGFVEWGALSRQRGCGRASQRAGVYLRAGLVLAAGLMTLYFWFKLHGAIVESLHGDGEPLVFFEGASLWMPTILRGLTVTVGVVALIVCLGRERREERQTFRAGGFFRMAVTEQDLRFRRLLKARFKAVPWPPAFWTGVSEFLPLGRLTSVGSPMVAWRQVERKTCALAAYAVVLGVGGSLLMLGLMSVMDDPTMPSRGREMATLTDFSSRAAMVVMLSLAIAVGLKQGLLRRYFSCVLDARAPLPSTTRGNPGAPRAAPAMTTKRKTALREIEDECLRQYLDETDARPRVDLADPRVRQLVWRCALLDIAGRLLPRRTWTSYVPVAMISLLVLARFGLFENQTVPPVFWIFVALVVALSLWNNVQIYRLAHSLKATLLADLERYGAIFKGLGGMPMHSGAPSPEATEAFFKVQMARIEGIRSGPFAALAEQPFVLALGIPAGGTLITEIVSLYTGAR